MTRWQAFRYWLLVWVAYIAMRLFQWADDLKEGDDDYGEA